MGIWHVIYVITLMSWMVEHIEISVHLTKCGEKLIVEHLLYTVSIATYSRTPGTILSLRKLPKAFDY